MLRKSFYVCLLPLYLQALQQTTTRRQSAGSKWASKEAHGVRKKMGELIAKAKGRATAKAKPKAAAKSKPSNIPLMSNLITAKGLDRTLQLSTHIGGIASFQTQWMHSQPLASGEYRYEVNVDQLDEDALADGETCRVCLETADGHACFAAPRIPHRELHTMSDCGSKGFAQNLWNNTRGNIYGTHCSDAHAHDTNNAIKRALVAAGVWLLCLEWGLVANFRKAPFNSDENYQKFKEQGANLFELIRACNFQFDLWESFFQDIAIELGLWDNVDDRGSVSHMERVLQSAQYYLDTVGECVKNQRWFAVWDSVRERLQFCTHIMLMVLIYRGFHSTWAEQAADLFLYSMSTQAPAGLVRTRMSESIAERRSVKESGDIFHRLRSDCSGTEHTVATILANSLGSHTMICLSVFIHFVRHRHGLAMQAAKDPSLAMQWRIDDAVGGWQSCLRQVCEATTSCIHLREAHFMTAERALVASPEEFQLDGDVADILHLFLIHLHASWILFLSQVEFAFPWRAAQLLSSPIPITVLQDWQAWWQTLQHLEEECKTHVRAQKFRMYLCWPLWAWVLHIFIVLQEFGFQDVPVWLRNRLQSWARGWLTTKPVEDTVHEIKKRSSATDLGMMSRRFRWAAQIESPLLSEYGLEPIKVQQRDKAVTLGQTLPAENIFDAAQDDMLSMADAHFNSIIDEAGKGRFPQMEPERFHGSGLAFLAYKQAGSFAALDGYWQSVLMPVGWLLCKHKPDDPPRFDTLGMVIHVCPYYCLVLRLGVCNRSSQLFSWHWPHPAQRQWNIVQIDDYNKFFVLKLQATSPASVHIDPANRGKWELAIHCNVDKMSPYVVRAQTAFLGVNVDELERLYTFQKLPTPRPTQERPLVEALVLDALPELHDHPDDFNTVLACRFNPAQHESVPTVMTKELAAKLADAIDARDNEDLDKALTARDKRQSTPATPATSASGTPASGGAGVQHVDPGINHPTLEWARQWKPPGTTLTRDDRRFFRWICQTPGYPQSSYSRTWNDERSPLQALRDLLVIVWDEHMQLRRHPSDCPFDIATLSPSAASSG